MIIINIALENEIKPQNRVLFKTLLKPFIPRNLITEELNGIYSQSLLEEMAEIIQYYNIYENGMDFPVNSSKDYVPSTLLFKKISNLLNKEARFMFAKSPDFTILPIDPKEKEKADIYQKYINEILKVNHVKGNLIKAAKDCFIGKRIAIICNFNIEYGITITFVPSLEFIYDTDEFGRLNKKTILWSARSK